MRSLRTLCTVGLVIVGVGCRDEARSLTSAPEPAFSPFYLTVSNQAAGAGSTVTVTASVVGARAARAVGSFAGHLRYDPDGLTFAAESKLPTGMRAFNAQPGHIRVAGAATEGFQDGRLFAVTFKVNDPSALTSIELTLDEVHGTDFGNQLPTEPHLRVGHVVRARR
jgi:hypothetical protein